MPDMTIEVYDPILGRTIEAGGGDNFADPIDKNSHPDFGSGYRVHTVAVYADGTQVVVSTDGRGHAEVWLTKEA